MAGIVFNATRSPTPLLENPPDGGTSSSSRTDATPKASFRDMVIGDRQIPPPMAKTDLISQKLMTVSLEGGNRILPKVTLHPKVFDKLCEPWRDAFVITLLGKTVGYRVMKDRLKKLWKPQRGFDILDVNNGYFMVKFDLQSDKERVTSGGPWMIFDHYLCVSHWTPEFASPSARIRKTLVWVCFPGLNLLYYDENVLLGLASVIGRTIRVDQNTLMIECGRFARVCVEIDLSLPVVGKFLLDGHWYRVEYEGLHLICSKCGCYGHVGRNCDGPCTQVVPVFQEPPSSQQFGNQSESQAHETSSPDCLLDSSASIAFDKPLPFNLETEAHGEWLTVHRKKRTPKQTAFGSASPSMEGLKASVARVNSEIDQRNNVGKKQGTQAGDRSGAKAKKRSHDGSQQQIIPTAPRNMSKGLDKGKVIITNTPSREPQIPSPKWPTPPPASPRSDPAPKLLSS